MKIVLKRYESLPKFYGVAYFSEVDMTAICYPVPINILVGFLRKVWHFLKLLHSASAIDKAFKSGYEIGRKDAFENGRACGISEGIKMAQETIASVIKEGVQ